VAQKCSVGIGHSAHSNKGRLTAAQLKAAPLLRFVNPGASGSSQLLDPAPACKFQPGIQVFIKSKLPKIPNSYRSSQAASVLSTLVIFMASTFVAFANPQDSPSESVADAARDARDRKAHSAKRVRLITNADLDVPDPEPNTPAFHVQSSLSDAAEEPALAIARTCDSPEARRLKRDLQADEQELARIRGELSHPQPVISDRDVDLQYFRPGNAGLNVGSPPLLNSEPLAPARVAQVEVEERIATLGRALRIVCAPPEAATTLIKIDSLEQQLHWSQRQFALDQNVYYSKTDFAKYVAEKAQLDAEQQQIQDLQAQIAQLKQALAAMNLPQP